MRFNFKFDKILALVTLFLVIFGLIMITSIGIPKSISLSAPGVLYPSCDDAAVDCYLLAKNHFMRLMIAGVAGMVILLIPADFLNKKSSRRITGGMKGAPSSDDNMGFIKKFSPFLYGITVFLLFLVMFMGSSHNTIATSWLVLFNTSLQPSELAKVTMVLFLAYFLAKKGSQIESISEGVIPFMIWSGLVFLPIVVQNDYGSALVIGIIAMAMFIMAGARAKHLLTIILIGILGVILISTTVPHVRERIAGFTKIDEECLEDYCWQSQQANIAVGSGGFWGKGLTQGIQKSYWLPQASDDFIFAASSEELGFIKIIFVVLAYFVFAWRGYYIAAKADSTYEMLVAVGITSSIVFQAFINIAVNTALFPVTGITLPFVSYGGSSLLASLIGVAILLRISANSSNSNYANSLNRGRDRRTRLSQYSRYR